MAEHALTLGRSTILHKMPGINVDAVSRHLFV